MVNNLHLFQIKNSMTNKQLEKLVSLYKKAVKNNLTAGEFKKELEDAKIQIDRSFVESGKEDINIIEYIDELHQLSDFSIDETPNKISKNEIWNSNTFINFVLVVFVLRCKGTNKNLYIQIKYKLFFV